MPDPPMRFSGALPPFVMVQEGFISKAKWDKNAWRIGFSTAVPGIGPDSECSREQATFWMMRKLREIADDLNDMVSVPLAQYQFDALGSFCYNVGTGPNGFGNSTMRRLLNEGNYASAANEFPRWDHDHNDKGELVVDEGLKERRLKEQAIFLGKGAPGYNYPGLTDGSTIMTDRSAT